MLELSRPFVRIISDNCSLLVAGREQEKLQFQVGFTGGWTVLA